MAVHFMRVIMTISPSSRNRLHLITRQHVSPISSITSLLFPFSSISISLSLSLSSSEHFSVCRLHHNSSFTPAMSFNSSDTYRALPIPTFSRPTIIDHYAHMRRAPTTLSPQSPMTTFHSTGDRRREPKPNAEDNVPARFELFILGEGERKVTEEADTRESKFLDFLASSSDDPWRDWCSQIAHSPFSSSLGWC